MIDNAAEERQEQEQENGAFGDQSSSSLLRRAVVPPHYRRNVTVVRNGCELRAAAPLACSSPSRCLQEGGPTTTHASPHAAYGTYCAVAVAGCATQPTVRHSHFPTYVSVLVFASFGTSISEAAAWLDGGPVGASLSPSVPSVPISLSPFGLMAQWNPRTLSS